jgi:hypothetical protein
VNISIYKNSSSAQLSAETLEEIDWCLAQLENMQSMKTISDLANTKVFIKIFICSELSLQRLKTGSRINRKRFFLLFPKP